MVWRCPDPPLFVFGTLKHPALRRRVLRRRLPPRAITWAQARHVRAVLIAGRSYPMLIPRPQGRVPGLLLRGLTARDWARLHDYEGDEYTLTTRWVVDRRGRRIQAQVYVARPWVRPSRYGYRG